MGEYLLVSCVHDYPKVCLLLIVEGTPPVGGRPQATCSQCLQYYPIIFGLQMDLFSMPPILSYYIWSPDDMVRLEPMSGWQLIP